jgi:hypothetical protein
VVILIGCQYFSSNCPQQNLARCASREGVIEIGSLIEVFFEFIRHPSLETVHADMHPRAWDERGGRASVWSCFSLWPWDKVGLQWQKRTSIAGTLSDSQYSEVPSLFTGAQEEPLNTPKPEGFGLSS